MALTWPGVARGGGSRPPAKRRLLPSDVGTLPTPTLFLPTYTRSIAKVNIVMVSIHYNFKTPKMYNFSKKKKIKNLNHSPKLILPKTKYFHCSPYGERRTITQYTNRATQQMTMFISNIHRGQSTVRSYRRTKVMATLHTPPTISRGKLVLSPILWPSSSSLPRVILTLEIRPVGGCKHNLPGTQAPPPSTGQYVGLLPASVKR